MLYCSLTDKLFCMKIAIKATIHLSCSNSKDITSPGLFHTGQILCQHLTSMYNRLIEWLNLIFHSSTEPTCDHFY